jgi:mannose-6-phosphate isomerase-like protein (cupin superfamily)
MTCWIYSLFFLVWAPLRAADLPGFAHWSGAELKHFEQKLSPKINAQKVALEQLGSFENHFAMIIYREGSGEAELHETQADVFVIQSGRATLVVGGAVVGGRTIGPGEIRGSSITGGEKKELAAGDIVHIPAKMPHQILLGQGGQITYFTLKVNAK